eukprot:TRINITY_DN13046_c0_g1_i1.p1 TRINITY_DN13046_c0_g1~~TRINITY_DN13046_c0_g1_i1.p1  ORF type:complete len:834 (-),score=42.74 TRINITY_DN13046_c0_g1_i1:117-2303(-)
MIGGSPPRPGRSASIEQQVRCSSPPLPGRVVPALVAASPIQSPMVGGSPPRPGHVLPTCTVGTCASRQVVCVSPTRLGHVPSTHGHASPTALRKSQTSLSLQSAQGQVRIIPPSVRPADPPAYAWGQTPLVQSTQPPKRVATPQPARLPASQLSPLDPLKPDKTCARKVEASSVIVEEVNNPTLLTCTLCVDTNVDTHLKPESPVDKVHQSAQIGSMASVARQVVSSLQNRSASCADVDHNVDANITQVSSVRSNTVTCASIVSASDEKVVIGDGEVPDLSEALEESRIVTDVKGTEQIRQIRKPDACEHRTFTRSASPHMRKCASSDNSGRLGRHVDGVGGKRGCGSLQKSESGHIDNMQANTSSQSAMHTVSEAMRADRRSRRSLHTSNEQSGRTSDLSPSKGFQVRPPSVAKKISLPRTQVKATNGNGSAKSNHAHQAPRRESATNNSKSKSALGILACDALEQDENESEEEDVLWLTTPEASLGIALLRSALTMVAPGKEAMHPWRADVGINLLRRLLETVEGHGHICDQDHGTDMIKRLFFDSIPRKYATISSVKLVVAPRLLKKINARVSEAKCSVEATFHGTRLEYVDAILEQGLNPSMCSTGAYGTGAYVGTHAGVAHQYADPDASRDRHMCVVLVVVGKSVKKGLEGEQAKTTAVDKMLNPTQYCFVDESRLYVSHVITYRVSDVDKIRTGGGWEDPFQKALSSAVMRAAQRENTSGVR